MEVWGERCVGFQSWEKHLLYCGAYLNSWFQLHVHLTRVLSLTLSPPHTHFTTQALSFVGMMTIKSRRQTISAQRRLLWCGAAPQLTCGLLLDEHVWLIMLSDCGTILIGHICVYECTWTWNCGAAVHRSGSGSSRHGCLSLTSLFR